MKNKEIRSIVLGSGNGRTIEGMIPYNSASEPLPWTEYLQRGCFSKTLKESKNIRALYAHDESQILASTKNGSLKFEDRDDGLHFSFELPNTRLGDDTLELVKTGLVDGCSFGMIVTKDEWSPRRDQRTIKELRLFEVSLCPQNQAYNGSSVTCRSLSEFYDGKEINEDDKKSILEEIERLNSLVNIEEPKSEPQPEEPKEEPSVVDSEPQSETDTQTEEPKEDDHYLEELNNRLDSLESLLASLEEELK